MRVLVVVLLLIASPSFSAECVVQPDLYEDLESIPGYPFTACGYPSDSLQAPSPTSMPHAFGSQGDTVTSGNDLCILPFTPQSWQFPGTWPDFEAHSSDMVIHNKQIWAGDMTFRGSAINWTNVYGGRVEGDYICGEGSNNVTVDGECICGMPVPEVGFGVGLAACVVVMATLVSFTERVDG